MGDGIPEPGSVLSLISNKNIRYEGVLVHIDMDSEAPSLRLKDGMKQIRLSADVKQADHALKLGKLPYRDWSG